MCTEYLLYGYCNNQRGKKKKGTKSGLNEYKNMIIKSYHDQQYHGKT